MINKRGKFLTLEGTEGVGKTTNRDFISSYLSDMGLDVLVTREPGGTPLAEEIRELLLANREEAFDHTAELLMIFAARSQHLNQVIIPALNQGKWVLCDRFTDATFAYQGFGRQLNIQVIEMLEQLVQSDLRPDKTFILDIDVELGLTRASQRGELDRFETEAIEFFQKVRSGYKHRANSNPDRYEVIDASQTLERVQDDIRICLDRLSKVL